MKGQGSNTVSNKLLSKAVSLTNLSIDEIHFCYKNECLLEYTKNIDRESLMNERIWTKAIKVTGH